MSDNSEKILKIVASVKEDSQKYMSEFKSAKRDIERRANKSIDLFGDSVYGDVNDIVSATRKACDTLYVELQTCVKVLDHQCKPLCDDDTPLNAIQTVWEMIVKLNRDSKIEASFTASLNYGSKNGIADVNYMPSTECRLIEKDWELKCKSSPDYVDPRTEKFQALKDRVERSKLTVNKQEEIEYTNDEEKYNEFVKEAEEKIKAFSIALQDYTKVLTKKFEENRTKTIAETEAYIRQLQSEYDSLGFLKFSRKKDLTLLIGNLKSKIEKAKQSYGLFSKTMEWNINSEKAEDDYSSVLNELINKKFKKIEIIRTVESDMTFPETPCDPQRELWLDLFDITWQTIPEIKENYGFEDSLQRIHANIRPLVGVYLDKCIVGSETKFALAGTPREELLVLWVDQEPDKPLNLPEPPKVEAILKLV